MAAYQIQPVIPKNHQAPCPVAIHRFPAWDSIASLDLLRKMRCQKSDNWNIPDNMMSKYWKTWPGDTNLSYFMNILIAPQYQIFANATYVKGYQTSDHQCSHPMRSVPNCSNHRSLGSKSRDFGGNNRHVSSNSQKNIA